MASSHSAYFSSRAVPCEAYASSELSLKSVAVMSLEQLCGALSNIINEPLWRPTIVVGLFLCYPTLISRRCSAVVGVARQHTPFGSPPRAWMGEGGQRSQSSDFLKEMTLIFCYPLIATGGINHPTPTSLDLKQTPKQLPFICMCFTGLYSKKPAAATVRETKHKQKAITCQEVTQMYLCIWGSTDHSFSWKQRTQSGIFFMFLWWHYRPSWYSNTEMMFLEYS